MRRRLLRLPGWMRRLMKWESHRLYGKPSFGWMSGEVTEFTFGRPGTPLHTGVMPLFYVALFIAVLLMVVGAIWPDPAYTVAILIAFFLPPIVSAGVVMLAINRWRNNDAFDELATLTFSRDAIRTMLLLPTGLVLRWLNLFLAIYLIFPLAVMFFTTKDPFEAFGLIIIAVLTLPLSFMTYFFGVYGVPVGWYLAIRFYGPNAIALALFHGFRLAASVSLIPGFLIYGAYKMDWLNDGGYSTLLILFIVYFCMRQAWELGVKLPRKWIRRDTRILEEHGIEVVRTPETLLEDEFEENPSHIDTFLVILWPWPRIFDMGMFEQEE